MVYYYLDVCSRCNRRDCHMRQITQPTLVSCELLWCFISRSTRRMILARRELGSKWTCESCEGKFFDLNQNPIICPRCDTLFHPPVYPKRKAPVSWQSKRVLAERPVGLTNGSDDFENADNLNGQEKSNDRVDSGFDDPDNLTR